jgi:hypothetical protein
VALVRVYCGVAAAEMAPWLTVAVVDDSSRLLDMRHISDDPAGYAYLGALLADRSGGAAPVAMDRHDHLIAQLLAAANRPLAIADESALSDFAERFTDDTSYEETQAPVSQRRAVGLARALQAGAVYATAQSPSWNLDEFKPVLAAHAAVTAGRQAAAASLREVLRELYPAALRAYPDPAEYVPLKVLEALPEPGLLSPSPSSRNREAALVAELSATGVADTTTAVSAITALRVAVEESPRWNTNRALAPVVAETVKQAVAAVRACDSASAALIATLVERLGSITGAAQPTRPYLVHSAGSTAPVSPAITRHGPAAEVPPSRMAPRVSSASAAASGVPAAVMPIPTQRNGSEYADPATYGQLPTRQPYPAPGYSDQPAFGEPSYGGSSSSYPGQPTFADQAAYQKAYAPDGYQEPTPYQQESAGYPEPGTYSGSRYETAPRHGGGGDYPGQGSNGSRHSDNGHSVNGHAASGGYPPNGNHSANGNHSGGGHAGGSGSWPSVPEATSASWSPVPEASSGSWSSAPEAGSGSWSSVPEAGSGSWQSAAATTSGNWPAVGEPASGSWPSVQPHDEEIAAVYAGLPARGGDENKSASATFNLDPLTAPMRNGSAPTSPARPGAHYGESQYSDSQYPGSPYSESQYGQTPGLRLVDTPADPLTDPMMTPVTPPALRVIDGGRRADPTSNPVTEDTDLLIFSQTQSNSAWFILADADAPEEEAPTWGHLADEGWRAAEQLATPQVGTATPAGLPRRVPQANLVPGSTQEPPQQLRIVRDPQSIAAHTSGYFRGWQRGQEIGGYAVGQRDRAAWEFNREQRARESEDQRARLS